MRNRALTIEMEKDHRFVRLEIGDKPCVVGFPVDSDHGYPLFACEPKVTNLTDLLAITKRVAAFRKAEAADKRAEKCGE